MQYSSGTLAKNVHPFFVPPNVWGGLKGYNLIGWSLA